MRAEGSFRDGWKSCSRAVTTVSVLSDKERDEAQFFGEIRGGAILWGFTVMYLIFDLRWHRLPANVYLVLGFAMLFVSSL